MARDEVKVYAVENAQGLGRLHVTRRAMWIEHSLRPGQRVPVGHFRTDMEHAGMLVFLDTAFGQINRAINHHRRRDDTRD